MAPGYAELHCISNYTFLRGASDPEELVHRAAQLGYAALAITDECSVSGIVRAHLAARDAGIRLLVGSEFRLACGLGLVLLAQTLSGYESLCELITRARRAAPKGEYRLARDDFPAATEGTSRALAAGDGTERGGGGLARRALPGQGVDRGRTAQGARRCSPDRGPRRTGRSPSPPARRNRRRAHASAPPQAPAGCAGRHPPSRARLPGRQAPAAQRRALPAAHRQGRGHPPAAVPGRHARYRRALHLFARRDPLRVSARAGARGRDAHLAPAGARLRGSRAPLSGQARPRPWSPPSSTSSRLIAEMGYEPFFLTVHDIVVFARPGASSARGAGRRPIPPSATAWASRRWIRPACPSSSSASSPGRETSPPTSTSTSSTSAARRSSSTSTESTGGSAPHSRRWSSPTSRGAPCATSARRSACRSTRWICSPSRFRGGTTATP